MTIKGRDLIMGLPKTVEITSEEVREAIHDSLMEIVECVKICIRTNSTRT